MADLSDTQRDMIEAIAAMDEDWPVVLLTANPRGVDMKVQPGFPDDERKRTMMQLRLAALYLMYIGEYGGAGVEKAAEDALRMAKRLDESGSMIGYNL